MFADDSQYFLRNTASIEECLKLLATYEKASGTKINKQKTKLLPIGTWKDEPPDISHTQLRWSNTPVKALGIEHGHNINIQEMWDKKLIKIKSNLNKWSNRDLTYKGKILLINTLALSVISYEIDCILIPERTIKEINEALLNFLWKGNRALIRREIIELPENEGGLKMPNIHDIICKRHIKYLTKIMEGPVQTWNAISRHWFTKVDDAFAYKYFLMKITSTNGLNLNIPTFHTKIFESWYKYCNMDTFETKAKILNESIFGNKNITYNKQSLFFKHWATSGHLNDIWDSTTNDWKSNTAIFEQLNDTRNWIFEYIKIKSSIPNKWKEILKETIAHSSK